MPPDPRRTSLELMRRISQLEKRVDLLVTQVAEMRRSIRQPRNFREAAEVTFVPWPENEPREYRGTSDHNMPRTPCDAWTGPCVCGGWHTEGR